MPIEFTFKTKRFQPTQSELDEEDPDYINPDIFARELADFLRDGLQSHGYEIEFRCPEDWGYWQEIRYSDRYTLAVGCSNIDNWNDKPCEHRIFIQPDKPFVRPIKNWFRKVHVRNEVEKLIAAVDNILKSEKQITDVMLSITIE